jgi:aryl-alcohol dehydrogenase-like predicted oxidoreductase
MEYVRLGRSNLQVSRIALGAMGIGDPAWRSWVLTEEAARPVVARALELGITLFDTCDFYSAGESERVLGRLLRELAPREEVVIATKVGNPMGRGPNARGYSRKHILEAVDASLQRLGTDYIDLYQTHIWDPATDVDEMVGAFDDVVRAGKVLYVGAADMPAWQLAKAVYGARAAGRAAFVSLQHHFNLAWREDEREHVPFCAAEGLGLLPYSPLGRGYLAADAGLDRDSERARTDDYARQWYGRAEDARLPGLLAEVAARRGTTAAQVALAWVLRRLPGSAPIVGAMSAEQVDAAVAAIEVELDPADVELLEAAYAPRTVGGHR